MPPLLADELFLAASGDTREDGLVGFEQFGRAVGVGGTYPVLLGSQRFRDGWSLRFTDYHGNQRHRDTALVSNYER